MFLDAHGFERLPEGFAARRVQCDVGIIFDAGPRSDDDDAILARQTGRGDLRLAVGGYDDRVIRRGADTTQSVGRCDHHDPTVEGALGAVRLLKSERKKRQRLGGGIRDEDEGMLAWPIQPIDQRLAMGRQRFVKKSGRQPGAVESVPVSRLSPIDWTPSVRRPSCSINQICVVADCSSHCSRSAAS